LQAAPSAPNETETPSSSNFAIGAIPEPSFKFDDGQWTTFVREYEQDFEKFTDTILADDTILPLDADADADDARTESLIEKGNLLIEELDPTVRERCKDDPAALAEWDAIMHSCDDPKEESPDHDADAS